VQLWAKIFEFANACAIAFGILIAPALAMALAVPSVAVAMLCFVALIGLLSISIVFKTLLLWLGWGAVYRKGEPKTPGSLIGDLLGVLGFVGAAEALLAGFVALLKSRRALWLEPWKPVVETYGPYIVYSAVFAYLAWRCFGTERHVAVKFEGQNINRRFMHTRGERIVLAMGIVLTAGLIVLKVTTGKTLADRIVTSWSQAHRIETFKPEFHALNEDERLQNGKMYASIAFDFDPRQWPYPVGVEARLKNTGPGTAYILGRMEARQRDGSLVNGLVLYDTEATREVERTLVFQKEFVRKPCAIVVRIAAKNEQDSAKLLEEAKRDPRKLVAITILGWSDDGDGKR
jgi:hypothetical protein